MALLQADQDLIAKDCVTGSQIAVIKECLEQKKTDIYNRIIAYLGGGYWMSKDGEYWNRISDLTLAYYYTARHPQWVVDRYRQLMQSYMGTGSYELNDLSNTNTYKLRELLSTQSKIFINGGYYTGLLAVYAEYWNIPSINDIVTDTDGAPSYIQLSVDFSTDDRTNLFKKIGAFLLTGGIAFGAMHDSAKFPPVACSSLFWKKECGAAQSSIATYAPQMEERRQAIVQLAQAWHDTDELINAVNSGEVDAFNQGLSPEQAQAIADARLKAAVAKQKALAKSIGAGADSMDAKTKQRKLIITGVILLVATAVVIALAKQLSKNK